MGSPPRWREDRAVGGCEPTDSSRGARAFTRFGNSLVIVGNDDTHAGKHPEYGWMTYAQTPAVWVADLGEW